MAGTQNGETVIRLENGGTRRFRSKQERREIVEETLKAGASVALIARKHGVNANQVFKWRAQYRKGKLEVDAPATLLPVRVSDAIQSRSESHQKSEAKKVGVIDIDLGHARVHIQGAADPACVRATLESLAR
jgi:transposase